MSVSSRFSEARILIVDDAAVSRFLITKDLTNANFHRLEMASDGTEALEKTYNLQPDLVILDLGMPNLDGFGYCQRVRDDPKMPRIPVIVQTEIEERQTKLRALSCGADDFLNKPIDPAELSLRTHIHLGRHFMLQDGRHFMLQDMSNMCSYLRMELEQAQHILPHVSQSTMPLNASKALNRHYEVLEEMAVLPTFGAH